MENGEHSSADDGKIRIECSGNILRIECAVEIPQSVYNLPNDALEQTDPKPKEDPENKLDLPLNVIKRVKTDDQEVLLERIDTNDNKEELDSSKVLKWVPTLKKMSIFYHRCV